MNKTTPTLTARQLRRRRGQEELAQEMKELLEQHSEADCLHWKGSRIDLMEALYYLFETNTLYNDSGNPVTFAELVRRACRLFHVPEPANPYEQARRGQQRKGIRQQNLLDRYCYLRDHVKENCSTLKSTYIDSCKK